MNVGRCVSSGVLALLVALAAACQPATVGDLANWLPDEVAGVPMVLQTPDPVEVLAAPAGESAEGQVSLGGVLRNLVARLGKTSSDLDLAAVNGSGISIFAVRVAGVSGDRVGDELANVWQEQLPVPSGQTLTRTARDLGGKRVLALVGYPGGTFYFGSAADSAYMLGAPDDLAAATALQAMP